MCLAYAWKRVSGDRDAERASEVEPQSLVCCAQNHNRHLSGENHVTRNSCLLLLPVASGLPHVGLLFSHFLQALHTKSEHKHIVYVTLWSLSLSLSNTYSPPTHKYIYAHTEWLSKVHVIKSTSL